VIVLCLTDSDITFVHSLYVVRPSGKANYLLCSVCNLCWLNNNNKTAAVINKYNSNNINNNINYKLGPVTISAQEENCHLLWHIPYL
jgi:hypothetical protein